MEKLPQPRFRVIYESQDITKELTNSLLSVTYADAETGESDSIDIEVEDVDGLWRGAWYPKKGDTISLAIGYDDALMPCGTFVVDEIAGQGPPDTISIRALAAATSSPLRTKNSRAFEEQTLEKIAAKIAEENGFSVLGSIPNLVISRVTQSRETDLAFLARIAREWGLAFSVRGTQLVFTSLEELDGSDSVKTLGRSDLISYTFRDKATSVFSSATASYQNPKTGKVVKFAYTGAVDASDKLEVKAKAETPAQAEQLAKAALHEANSKEFEGSLTVIGDPLLVAGSNFVLSGMGQIGGLLHITKSSHTITRGGGYTTSLDFRRVQAPTSAQQTVSTKPKGPQKFAYT